MRKQYIFTETGEVRPPKRGEYYAYNKYTDFQKAPCDYNPQADYPIFSVEVKEVKFVPKKGEVYYFVTDNLRVLRTFYEEEYTFSEARINIGNCFETEAEAQIMADKFKALLKGESL